MAADRSDLPSLLPPPASQEWRRSEHESSLSSSSTSSSSSSSSSSSLSSACRLCCSSSSSSSSSSSRMLLSLRMLRPSSLPCLLLALFLVWSAAEGQGSMAQTTQPPVCTVKGRIYTEKDWYGYLVQKPFHRDWAKIQYQITYPVKECCVNLLIYYDDQLKQLHEENTCKERVAILPSDNNQVIPLFSTNRTVGCSVWNNTGEPYYICLGERIFRSSGPRTWYFALSRCGSNTPLNLNYVFNISGYYGECESDALSQSCVAPSPAPDKFLYVAVGLGVVAGIGLILASVFFTLWLQDRRRSKSKGSSVTSSQATMTQDDVFYVNPSLSDREQTDYSQTSSENYYEVIPERRSYESINTHLAVPGHPGAHARHAAHLKDLRPFHPALVFDDYPPPPYQPPRGMGVPRHHTLHHPPHHHHHHFLHAHGHPHAAGGANHHPAATATAAGNAATLQQLQSQLQAGQGQMQGAGGGGGQGQSHSMSAFGPATNLGPLRERAAAATHTETSA